MMIDFLVGLTIFSSLAVGIFFWGVSNNNVFRTMRGIFIFLIYMMLIVNISPGLLLAWITLASLNIFTINYIYYLQVVKLHEREKIPNFLAQVITGVLAWPCFLQTIPRLFTLVKRVYINKDIPPTKEEKNNLGIPQEELLENFVGVIIRYLSLECNGPKLIELLKKEGKFNESEIEAYVFTTMSCFPVATKVLSDKVCEEDNTPDFILHNVDLKEGVKDAFDNPIFDKETITQIIGLMMHTIEEYISKKNL